MKHNPWMLLAAMTLLAIPLAAHHSFGLEYDSTKPITLTGVVTKIEWTNPHSYLLIDVKDDKGNVASWKFEGYRMNVYATAGYREQVHDL
jgi:Family of unknown function (DUF6152)